MWTFRERFRIGAHTLVTLQWLTARVLSWGEHGAVCSVLGYGQAFLPRSQLLRRRTWVAAEAQHPRMLGTHAWGQRHVEPRPLAEVWQGRYGAAGFV
jgi:hypothetical protein